MEQIVKKKKKKKNVKNSGKVWKSGKRLKKKAKWIGTPTGVQYNKVKRGLGFRVQGQRGVRRVLAACSKKNNH